MQSLKQEHKAERQSGARKTYLGYFSLLYTTKHSVKDLHLVNPFAANPIGAFCVRHLWELLVVQSATVVWGDGRRGAERALLCGRRLLLGCSVGVLLPLQPPDTIGTAGEQADHSAKAGDIHNELSKHPL